MITNEIIGVTYFDAQRSQDSRGQFSKFYNKAWLDQDGYELGEAFYSDSITGVIRGIHLQVAEASGPRIVTILSGVILDVLIDLRPESETYLIVKTQVLTPEKVSSVYIPAGVAHGFQAIEDSRTLYLSQEVHNPSLDTGIDAFSIGVEWPIVNPIRSFRDENLPTLNEWLKLDK